MKRRPFLKIAAAAGTGPLILSNAMGAEGDMPYRKLGKTGLNISVIGFPGLAMAHATQEECDKAVRDCLDKGINYFDVAPAYGKDGLCEKRMGVSMKDIPRDKYYLACKTKMRDKEGARMELERSLKRLNTDHFDVYQFHHLRRPDEVDEIFAPGGAMETFLEARKEGKIRFIGFSAHTTKSALLALEKYAFDTVMFPINYVEHYTIDFCQDVLNAAAKHGSGVLSIKSLSAGRWGKDEERYRKWWYKTIEEPEEISRALRFVLAQKGVTSCFTPSFLELNAKAIQSMRTTYGPIQENELVALEKKAKDCTSLFEREENRVSHGGFDLREDEHPELCPCAHA